MNRIRQIKSRNIINIKRKKIALVTGVSSGIGLAFTKILAREGYDIVAIARDQQKLRELETSLYEKYKTKIYPVPLDLSKPDSINIISKFLENENLSVDLLINNAGFGIHGAFHETDITKETELINLQLITTINLIKLVLPNMQKNNFGYILNVGSVYSFSPVPYQSVYGGCKAFLQSFTSAIAFENKKFGIKICSLCPGITQTEFRTRSKINELSDTNVIEKASGMSAEDVAEQGFKALLSGKLICIPGLTNRIFVQVATYLPTSFFSSTLALINNIRGVNTKHT